MFNLINAGSALKKVAYSEGIRTNKHNAWYTPKNGHDEIKAIIGDNTGKEVEVTIFDLEHAEQFTWKQVRRGEL